jgi:hypothetical protein
MKKYILFCIFSSCFAEDIILENFTDLEATGTVTTQRLMTTNDGSLATREASDSVTTTKITESMLLASPHTLITDNRNVNKTDYDASYSLLVIADKNNLKKAPIPPSDGIETLQTNTIESNQTLTISPDNGMTITGTTMSVQGNKIMINKVKTPEDTLSLLQPISSNERLSLGAFTTEGDLVITNSSVTFDQKGAIIGTKSLTLEDLSLFGETTYKGTLSLLGTTTITGNVTLPLQATQTTPPFFLALDTDKNIFLSSAFPPLRIETQAVELTHPGDPRLSFTGVHAINADCGDIHFFVSTLTAAPGETNTTLTINTLPQTELLTLQGQTAAVSELSSSTPPTIIMVQSHNTIPAKQQNFTINPDKKSITCTLSNIANVSKFYLSKNTTFAGLKATTLHEYYLGVIKQADYNIPFSQNNIFNIGMYQNPSLLHTRTYNKDLSSKDAQPMTESEYLIFLIHEIYKLIKDITAIKKKLEKELKLLRKIKI